MSDRKEVQNTPSLRALSFALRNRETWPSAFDGWNFASCYTCAMGLAALMWPQQIPNPQVSAIAPAFGISAETASQLFCSTNCDVFEVAGITPEIVADRIDRHLATTELVAI